MKVVRTLFQFIYEFFYELILGCSHHRLTRPFTLEKETYMVCLDCGKQLYYSPTLMRPLTPHELRRLRAVQASEVRMIPSGEETGTLIRRRTRKSNAA